MTLSLTMATPSYILQATDRLASDTGTRRPYDRASNKNVVYQASDAILAIAYSGRSYIEDPTRRDEVPTDQWIAELLAGEKFFEDEDEWSLRMGRALGHWLDYKDCLAVLREAVKSPGVASTKIPISIAVTGWVWNKHRRRARPKLSSLRYDGRSYREERLPRRCESTAWDQPRGAVYPCSSPISFPPRAFAWVPDGNFSFDLARQLTRGALGCLYSPKAMLKELVRAIRKRSLPGSGIGKDCLGICLPHPSDPRVQIAYQAAQDYGVLQVGDTEVGAPDFSPWIVGRNNVQKPTVVVGGAPTFWLDDFVVEQFVRPARSNRLPSGARVTGAQTRQRRKPPPRRLRPHRI